MSNPLGVTVTHADGSTTRWAGDERLAENIPSGITCSTSVPGGYKDATLTLPRRIDRDYPDVSLFDDVRIWGPANETVWNGRVVAIPRSHSDTTTLTIQCVGWASHLRDMPFFREVYVDRDLSHWQGMSRQRKLNWLGTGAATVQDGQIEPDVSTGIPALVLAIDGSFTELRLESWYDSGPGLAVASDYSDYVGNGTTSTWDAYLGVADDDVGTNEALSADLSSGTNSSGTTTFTPATPRRWAFVRLRAAGPVGDDVRRSFQHRRLAVWGNHGLTKQGTAPNDGLYASDVIANIVSRAAPLLTYTTGAGGSISPTTFVIPQLEFRDPVTAEDAILRTNAYHLWEWGVYGGANDASGYPAKTFFFRPPDPNRCQWEARLSDGAHLDLEGDQGDTVYNGVVVTYTDTAGVTHTVGPPGSGAEATDATLADTSSSNPINAHGIPARYAQLSITPITTQTGAIQIGSVFLAEQSLPQRRGQLTVKGTLQHPTQGRRPVWQVRAGDYIRLQDHPTDVPRRIIETSYSDDTGELVMSLDNSVWKVEALLERIGVSMAGVI